MELAEHLAKSLLVLLCAEDETRTHIARSSLTVVFYAEQRLYNVCRKLKLDRILLAALAETLDSLSDERVAVSGKDTVKS